MACSIDFIEFVCDALAPLGEVCSRKMMGEYVIYVNGKCVITACDNTAHIKQLPCNQISKHASGRIHYKVVHISKAERKQLQNFDSQRQHQPEHSGIAQPLEFFP